MTASPTEDPAGQTPAAGMFIGKYKLDRVLGKGGMGAVWKASDPHLERDVAIKVMLPQLADDPEHKQRFEREARAIARLTHPNVVMVFDLGYHTDGSPYIVMEYLRGGDLLGVLRRESPLSLERTAPIVLGVLDGLAQAHRVGIVHRDIKPANVFVGEDGAVKIMDFGVARLASSGATSSGTVVGTANYMSPEQVTGAALDGRSDLFSVGCLLVEMLTGERPFEADNPMSTLFRVATGQPTINLPASGSQDFLLPLLRKALARKPEDRFATAAEFAGALRAVSLQPEAAASAAVSAGKANAPTQAISRPLPPPVEPTPPPDPTPLFRLLRDVYVGGKSGDIHLTHGAQHRGVRVLRGHIVHASSDVDGEHLGQIMVRYGLLRQEDLDRARDVALPSRRPLGGVLGEMGLATPDKVEEALGLHVREILFAALEQPGGSFLFEERGESLIEANLASRQSTGQVILEATRRVQDPALVRRALGETGRILELSTDPLLRQQAITLTPVDGFVLSRIDGTVSAREVLSLIPLPAEEVERSLFGLLCTGMVSYREVSGGGRRRAPGTVTSPGRGPSTSPMSNPPTDSTRPPQTKPGEPSTTRPPEPPTTKPPERLSVAPAPSPAPRAKAPTSTPSTPLPPGNATPQENAPAGLAPEDVRRLVLDKLERMATATHFDILDVPPTAGDADVRKAYGRLVRVLHPDACRGPELAAIDAQREAVFLRVTQAFDALRDPEARAQYQSHLRLWKPRAATPGPQSPAPSTTTAPAPPAPVPAAPSVFAAPVSADIPVPVDTPASADTPVSATAPESAGPSVLVMPPPRPNGATPTPAAPSAFTHASAQEEALLRAEMLLADAKYWELIQAVEPLLPQLGHDNRARAQVLLARAYLKNPRWHHRAEETLKKAVASSPQHGEAWLLLGGLYAAEGLRARAAAAYQRALEADPGSVPARRGLAAMRHAEPESQPAPPTSGRLSRLLNRR